ncbi:helix-turn-helix domain-containing protein [Novosphingobium sp. RD2P27]|uniref:Helix-turn-helix domain-containing protein n=1 Tax=Novosphingobium kalidii TaxID=3230299 RepID=A0ABV2D3G3_9SPHN
MTHRSLHPIAALVDELLRLTPRLRGVFSEAAASKDLAPMEATVLSATIDARTPPTVPRIGRSLGHPRQVIQRAANGLIAKRLIEPTANPDHQRAPLLVATPAGERVKFEVDARAKASLDVLLSIVTPERCEMLVGQLRDFRVGTEAYLKDHKEHHLG